MKNYVTLPDAPRGSIILNQKRSYVSVILPDRGINLIPDPEFLGFASGTMHYNAIGTTLVPTADRQRRGLYGVHVGDISSPATGISHSPTFAMQANVPHTFSVDHFGHGRYMLAIIERPTQQIVSVTHFEGSGFWKRISVTGMSSANILVDLQLITLGGLLSGEYQDGFWTDGWQWERKPYPTTFISGALTGFEGETPNPYGWMGPPHNSSSFRRETTRSGGKVVPFSELGLDIYEIEGLGMGKPSHSLQSYALDHGGIFGCSRIEEREFTLTGSICGINGIVDLHCTRQNLSQALNPLFGRPKQPVRLLYQLYECDDPVSPEFYIDSFYDDGMGFSLSNPHIERVDVDMLAADPFVYEMGSSAYSLNIPDGGLDTAVPGIPARGEDGSWRITTPQNSTHIVRDFEVGPDGYMYALTSFVSTTRFQRFDGFEWQIVLSFDGAGQGMASTPDGGIYVVGGFSFSIGPNQFNNIFRYDVVTGAITNLQNSDAEHNGSIYTVLSTAVYHPSGRLIVGGAFDSIGNDSGTVAASNVAAYDIARERWGLLGVAPLEGLPDSNGSVLALTVSPAGHIFAGGDFSANYASIAYTMENLAYFDISRNDRWRFVDDVSYNGDWLAASVYALKFAPNGNLYVGGHFNDTLANSYTGTLGNTWMGGIHHPITNIGYFTNLAGDLSGLAGAGGPIIPRMRPIQNGTTECFCQGANPTGNCASDPGGACPEGSIVRPTYVYDIAISCSGDIWIAGIFDRVLGDRLFGPDLPLPPGRLNEINSIGVARISRNHRWIRTEIVFAPGTYNVPGTPLFTVHALEFGSRCDPHGFVNLLGLGTPGPDTSDDDTGVPADFADSLFVGIIITNSNAPYVLFPRRTIVDTRCSEDSRPVIRIQGPGRLRSIRNVTIGVSIDFNDYPLIDGEILTIDMSGRTPRVYSNFAARNAFDLVTNVSQIGRFYLTRGRNLIDIMLYNVDDDGNILSGALAWIEWVPRYLSVDVACAAHC